MQKSPESLREVGNGLQGFKFPGLMKSRKEERGQRVRESHTQRSGRIHNLIAGGCMMLAAAGGLGIWGESMDGRNIQAQYESLAQMAGRETGTEKNGLPETGLQQGGKTDETAEIAETGKTNGQEKPYKSPIDFEKLSEINPDIKGWIRIPDTGIDYPIVQGSDNHVYLHKSFSGEEADAGCIFLDFESQGNLRGYNNILYGHNMKNGTMFRDVARYKDEDYFKEHQYFEIYTPEETIHLKAVSCYYIQDDPEVRRTEFHSKADFGTFVIRMLEPCPYAYMPQMPIRNLYTLVTCSYESEDARTVLFAVEADGEKGDRRQAGGADVQGRAGGGQTRA